MANTTSDNTYLVAPNTKGEVSLGDLPTFEEYLASRRADGTIVLKPITKTPFIGESSESATPAPTST